MRQVTGEGKQGPQSIGGRHGLHGIVGQLHEVAVQVKDAGVLHPSRCLQGLQENKKKMIAGYIHTKYIHTTEEYLVLDALHRALLNREGGSSISARRIIYNGARHTMYTTKR